MDNKKLMSDSFKNHSYYQPDKRRPKKRRGFKPIQKQARSSRARRVPYLMYLFEKYL